jgi:hypothetical protein
MNPTKTQIKFKTIQQRHKSTNEQIDQDSNKAIKHV